MYAKVCIRNSAPVIWHDCLRFYFKELRQAFQPPKAPEVIEEEIEVDQAEIEEKLREEELNRSKLLLNAHNISNTLFYVWKINEM